ncbi:diguanylate phosphodiesterase [Saccharomonospora sp. CUA-673]|uniref:helix-turn-helix domain-containing protein n=1 Tax=Saccharomonospora sp. CUA-673 TaxID=1904969 RepID=UPI0009684757|nr:GAF domain-containing protein [Saccharomonospora sp. CUA-673]OLT47871.1 diguanylate phosphodiesterase [Saccharomonospora sp. CUA-673]
MSDGAVRLLRLLADGAPAEELAKALADGTGGQGPADEEALRSALTVRRTLDAHTRRETELAALFDTASDLARLRDLDAVLRSIVHRARMLLRVDVSYLSLNDDGTDSTYMRVTEGSASALFQQVRIGMGEGLGGLVAQTVRPYATSNYPADARFRHTGPIDRAVGDEGLIAILGVPLALGDRVIGVLYASDRRPRTFTPDEVALLSSLADHAAIAIDNARLIESTAAALDELGEANDTIRAHHEALARAQEAHDRLAELAAGGADVPQVAAEVAAVLGGGVVVHDPDGGELAGVPVGDADARPRRAYAVAASRASGRAVADGDDWVCAVMAGPQLLGSITLTGRPDLGDADRRLFERAGMVTALVLLLRSSTAEAEERVRGELLSDLLSAPDRDPGSLVERGRRLGVDLHAPHAVLLLHTAADGGVTRARLASAAAEYGVLEGVHADRVVLLARDAEPGRIAPEVASDLTRRLGCLVTVGGAGPASEPERIAEAHAEAARCLRALLLLGRHGSGADAAALGFVGMLLGDRADVAGFVRDTLGPVLDYDEARGTELLRTLEVYFACGGNLTRAKQRLHVHVNTVSQRLERIGVLLGEDWQSPDRALELQLALRLHHLR